MFKVEDNFKIVMMNKGDGLEVTQSNTILLRAANDCEVIIIDTID
jgi:hypothetical protein